MTRAIPATGLGMPRMGPRRELKRALEDCWAGKLGVEDLEGVACDLRRRTWQRQRDLGIDHIPSNDFSLYDHVLDTAVMVGAVPDRYLSADGDIDLDAYFAMARGSAGEDQAVPALEMTKWFDTNYHYIVPELAPGQRFQLTGSKAVDELREAAGLGIATRPVLLGPISFLVLSKQPGGPVPVVSLLPGLLSAYEAVLADLAGVGAQWVQIDEPALGLDLDAEIVEAFPGAYHRLAAAAPELRLLVATYFSGLRRNLPVALGLPVAALHLDVVREPAQLDAALDQAPESLALSLGVLDGRNVWLSDLDAALATLERARSRLGPERLLVAPSCSLLHMPLDLDLEAGLDAEVRPWLAFAHQRLEEVVVLARALDEGRGALSAELELNAASRAARSLSQLAHDPAVAQRLAQTGPEAEHRLSPFPQRRTTQAARLALPILPTTTIGSFPQTPEVRSLRARLRRGELDTPAYEARLAELVAEVVRFQKAAGLDVLVHGEFERNDMVEHFAEHLDGFAVTTHGWVQSYGSRCVKPPIIFGDVSRPAPITVGWWSYAQSLTDRPVKGMLTGPVTMLAWSFARDDQPESQTCRQIALAMRDEVADLEAAGAAIIQIDEPALRELMPLHDEDRDAYLAWAVAAFRLASSGVADKTQIHTHMCYAEFGDIIDAITAFDADVISIETSRSAMELLETFTKVSYPNQIGPGVWDIHSPRVPDTAEMVDLLELALAVLGPAQLWVNPDCGLKTRGWDEVKPALANMVEAARLVRERIGARA
ncbi:MAG: 5-methyltetrahydropteroyltriglutamate--homocysteine S-methyltransferase [Acidimicrobiales bacterium]